MPLKLAHPRFQSGNIAFDRGAEFGEFGLDEIFDCFEIERHVGSYCPNSRRHSTMRLT